MKIKVTDLFTHFKKDAGHGRIHQAIMDRETEWKNEFTNARSHAGVHDVYSESTTTYQVWFSLQLNNLNRHTNTKYRTC